MDSGTEMGPPGLWHAVMPYQGAGELAVGVAGFVKAGALAGDAVLIAVAAAGLGLLRDRLDVADGQVAWADISSTGRNPARLTALLREFAAGCAGQRLWCVHEPAWPARSAAELREVHRHEARLNLVLAGASASVLCPYDMRLGAGVIGCAGQTHPTVIRGLRPEVSSSFCHGVVPAECDLPLSPAPMAAERLTYRDDLAPVRRLVASRARRAGLAPQRVADLVIAVSELAANTLAHTSGRGTLCLWDTGSEVICQVEDTGQITDVLAGTERPDPADPGGGQGLWLMNQLCDLAEVRTGAAGTVTRVHMRLDG